MIIGPNAFKNESSDDEFVRVINFFNDLAKRLEYPQCEGNADAVRILKDAKERYNYVFKS